MQSSFIHYMHKFYFILTPLCFFQYALHVYNNLVSVGKKYDMLHAGYYAMRSLRIEKFYAFWGQDLDSTTTPLECGRGFRVKLNVCFSPYFY